MNNDKLIIGGHEFNSRFILGSGKYSMKLIEAAVKEAGQKSSPLRFAVQTPRNRKAFLTIFPKGSPCFQTPAAQEMQKKRFVSLVLPVSLAAVIS